MPYVKFPGDITKLSFHSRQWMEHMEATPRKESGTIAYYFKPETKYPPRIYLFIHSEMWQNRNLRPMGLHGSHPFLRRPMTIEEIEENHFNNRMRYFQYENWEKLLKDEAAESVLLDKYHGEGYGAKFLKELESFKVRYRLFGEPPKPKVETPTIIKSILPKQLLLF